MSSHATFTGFGDETNTSVKFRIVAPGGRIAGWSGGAKLRKLEIPHSDSQIIQVGGREERTISLRVHFASVADLEMMDDLQGTRATLRYRANRTKKAGGYLETLQDGVTYLVLPDTLLEQVSDETYQVFGPCEATLTFSRAGTSSAYYGFAVYAEDEP